MSDTCRMHATSRLLPALQTLSVLKGKISAAFLILEIHSRPSKCFDCEWLLRRVGLRSPSSLVAELPADRWRWNMTVLDGHRLQTVDGTGCSCHPCPPGRMCAPGTRCRPCCGHGQCLAALMAKDGRAPSAHAEVAAMELKHDAWIAGRGAMGPNASPGRQTRPDRRPCPSSGQPGTWKQPQSAACRRSATNTHARPPFSTQLHGSCGAGAR